MEKPYHLMTAAEKIAARIATNRAIEQRVKEGTAASATHEPGTRRTAADFARIGHAFLDSLPDIEKGTEAASLLKLAKGSKNKK
jgi:hypothetical protein